MNVVVPLLFAVLIPAKAWYAPGAPLTVSVKSDAVVTLLLTDFSGKQQDAVNPDVPAGSQQPVDLHQHFPALANPGTYVLYALPKGGAADQFLGTPLVISVREDKRRGAPPGPMVIKVEPLRYAVMQTEHGAVTMGFYYDVAPHTVANFLSLAENGFYDGLTFHRIVQGFVVQGGDPRGDGTGGPGYMIDDELSDRPHVEGVLSMARGNDYNSAGSQFFICLDYQNTKMLDRKYTAFGAVTEGMDAVKKIAAAAVADQQTGRPAQAQPIRKVEVLAVTAKNNPYPKITAPRAPAAGEGAGGTPAGGAP